MPRSIDRDLSVTIREDLERLGFAWSRRALSRNALAALRALVEPLPEQTGVRRRRGGTYAARNLLWDRPEAKTVLTEAGLDRIAAEALIGAAFPISVTLLDKNPAANWHVPGHQDVIMPVSAESQEPGFTGWSRKVGIVYVEPPVEVLSELVALRVHLDDCPKTNGALAVVPGSHARGRLRDAEIAAVVDDRYEPCEAAAGDVLLMRPLLVHRSAPATIPSRRRVLHIVYATKEPGLSVRWKRA
jgi:Phytanoyl-CoA dioxygenase (PhyH)